MASTQFENNLRGFLQLLDDDTLKVSLDEALRTAVKDILLLIYKQRFRDTHPQGSLTSVAKNCPAMKSVFLLNKSLLQLVNNNDETKFDITALYQFLRHLCGLPKKEESWNKSKDTLPGPVCVFYCTARTVKNAQDVLPMIGEVCFCDCNDCKEFLQELFKRGHICCLKEVRNSVSHRTIATKDVLMEQWSIVVESSKETLSKSGNIDRIPEFMLKFQTLLGAGSVFDKLIMELQDIFSSKEKTTLKPLVWAGVTFSYHKHVKKTYTSTSISVCDDRMKVHDTSSTDILSKCTTMAVILEGESGTGKTALLRYLASSWKTSSASQNISLLNTFDLVLFLDCDGIKLRSPNVNSIIQEILPKTCFAFGMQQILKEITKDNLKVLFLIDAFDERLDYMSDIFEDLQKMFRNAKFLISTRPHCSAKIKSLCIASVSIAVIKGFDYHSTRSFLKNMDVEENEFQEFLSWISAYKDIKRIPQLLTWTLYLWKEDKKKMINNSFILYNDLTYFMIKKLCYINKQRIMANSLPEPGQLWLKAISELAYRCLLNNQMILTDDHPDIENLLCKATELKFRDPYEALSTLMHSQSSMSGDGEVLHFQFIHVSHVEYLVAYHVVQRLKTSSASSKSLIKNLSSLSDEQVFNILQFVLSLSDTWWSEDSEGQLLMFVGEFITKYLRMDNIHLILALIDCSNKREKIAQIFAKKWNEKFKSEPFGVMWIRYKDLRYKESLEIFLTYVAPKRIWANFGHVDISLSTSTKKKENVNLFLGTLRKAFDKRCLIQLTISHGIFDSLSTFQRHLSWLSLIDCEFQQKLSFPKTLLKLNIASSSNHENLDIPKQVESLVFHDTKESVSQIPTSVKHVKFTLCDDIPSLHHLYNLESLSIGSYICWNGLLSLPTSLKKLECSPVNLSIFKSILQAKTVNSVSLVFLPSLLLGDNEGNILIETLDLIKHLAHLKNLSVAIENTTADQILEFITDLISIDELMRRKMNIIIIVIDSLLNEFMAQIMQESMDQLNYVSLKLKFSNMCLDKLSDLT